MTRPSTNPLVAIGWAVALAGGAIAAPAAACPPSYSASLVGIDRNLGGLEVGDLLDWTLEILNGGCIEGMEDFPLVLAAEHDPVTLGQGASWNPSTRTVTWSVSIPAAGTAQLTLTTRLIALPPVNLCAQVARLLPHMAAPSDDPRTLPPADPTCIPAAGPHANPDTVISDGGGDGRFSPGETVTLRFRIANDGDADLAALRVRGALPAGLENLRVASLPAGAIDRSSLAMGVLVVEEVAVARGEIVEVRVEGELGAAAPAGARRCASAELEGAAWESPLSFAPPDGIGTELCFTIDPGAGTALVSAMRPCRIGVGGGEAFAVEGAGFEPGARVRLGGVDAAVESIAPQLILARVPETWPGGVVDVEVENTAQPALVLPAAATWVGRESRRLRLTRSASEVLLVGDGSGHASVERSETPHFVDCGGDVRSLTDRAGSYRDAVVGDGRTWFYRMH